MLETVEATIDPVGRVVLKEKVSLRRRHRALVTILDETEDNAESFELVGSAEIIGDLEEGSAKISEMFRDSIERSAKELNK
ncbi:MAG: hypothetical protein K1X52_03010 [Pyrinomonadaceae bacterium]|nr:hypothetical protein [Pyrinomonadaceae bacterium]